MEINGLKIEPRANLREADLRWANLRGANLQGANLQGANLQGANLQGANLQGANLQGANLQWANLREANLREANLDFSVLSLQCSGTNFKICEKIAKQIVLHALELSIDFFPGGLTTEQVDWLMSGHRASEGCFQAFFEKVNKRG